LNPAYTLAGNTKSKFFSEVAGVQFYENLISKKENYTKQILMQNRIT